MSSSLDAQFHVAWWWKTLSACDSVSSTAQHTGMLQLWTLQSATTGKSNAI